MHIAVPSRSRVVVLPAVDPKKTGLSLVSYPKHADLAVEWPVLDLEEALDTEFGVDAHASTYAPTNGDRAYRLSLEALAMPIAAETFLSVVWSDLDTPDHEPWSDQKDLDNAVDSFSDAFPELGVYATRSGLRLVGMLERPVPIKQAQAWLAVWHQEKSALASTLPGNLVWDLTSAEWTRFFRLPKVTRDGKKTWEAADIDLIRHLKPIRDGKRTNVKGDPSKAPQVAVQVTIGQDLRPDQIPEPPKDWRAYIHAGSKVAKYVEVFETGDPFGPPHVKKGTRNPALKTAINSIGYQTKGRLTAREIYAIVARSVEAEHARDSGAPTLDDAWRFALATDQSVKARVTAAPPTTNPVSDPAYAPNGAPLMVVHKGSVYLYDDRQDTYTGPYVAAEVPVRLQHDTNIPTRTAKGRMRSVADILATHGTPADSARLAYPGALDAPSWEPQQRRVTVNLFRDLQDITPQHHSDVAEWLDLMAGNHSEIRDRFYKWLGTVTYLGDATAALYLEGPPGCGKGMLAMGLSGLWGVGCVTFREAVVDRFNAGLLESPIIFLDEGAPAGREITSKLRTVIASTQHRIEPKGLPQVTLHGSPRVIMAANNEKLIRLHGGHGDKDLNAIIGRILHVDVGSEPAEWLTEYGGKPATKDWLAGRHGPGRLVEHLAYIRQTIGEPYYRSGTWGRYLVAGYRTKYHTHLITSDPLYSQVLCAVATSLGGTGRSGIRDGIMARKGYALVNPRRLHDAWKALVTEDQFRPRLQEISEAVRAMSASAEVSVVGEPYWRISKDLILTAAHECGMATEDTKKRLEEEAPQGGQGKADTKTVGFRQKR